MDYIQKGNLTAHLIYDKEPTWRVFFNDYKVAECLRSDWDNVEVDFLSKDAGQAIVDTMNDMYDHLFAAASQEKEAEMHKTDDTNDVTEDVDQEHVEDTDPPEVSEEIESAEAPADSDSGCCGQCDKAPGHAPCDSEDVEVGEPKGVVVEEMTTNPHEGSPEEAIHKLVELLHNMIGRFKDGDDATRDEVVREASYLFDNARVARLLTEAELQVMAGQDASETFSKIAVHIPDPEEISENLKPELPEPQEIEMPHLDQHVAALSWVPEDHAQIVLSYLLDAFTAIDGGLDIQQNNFMRFAIMDGLGGDTQQYGETSDQEFCNNSETGEDPAGEQFPDDGDAHTLHEGEQDTEEDQQEPDKLVHASSNKTCANCGMPTDSGAHAGCKVSKDFKGNQPQMTEGAVKRQHDKQFGSADGAKGRSGPPHKGNSFADMTASQDETIMDRMVKAGYIPDEFLHLASHFDEHSISASSLKLDGKIDYHMSGREQEVANRISKYLKAEKYPHTAFTIVRVVQDGATFKVHALVFDRGLNYTAGSNDTNLKTSNIENYDGIQQTAFKNRLTQLLGGDDKLGLVSCPIESNHLTASCGTCPFAGNATTYIQDGAVECHFDEGHVWLNGLGVHEPRPSMNNPR